MTATDSGNATTSASQYTIGPSNSTWLPVSILHTGRNTELLLLTKSAQNRYDPAPAAMLQAAARLSGRP